MVYMDRTFCDSKDCVTTDCFRHRSSIPAEYKGMVSVGYFEDRCPNYKTEQPAVVRCGCGLYHFLGITASCGRCGEEITEREDGK